MGGQNTTGTYVNGEMDIDAETGAGIGATKIGGVKINQTTMTAHQDKEFLGLLWEVTL
jgi:hypothetical protein